MTADRTYWHVPGARSWHAENSDNPWFGLCGRQRTPQPQTRNSAWGTETADRLPSTAHLCGSCSRVIAARTDIEISTVGTEAEHARARQMAAEHGPGRVSDVPEPVASEQDDSGIAPV